MTHRRRASLWLRFAIVAGTLALLAALAAACGQKSGPTAEATSASTDGEPVVTINGEAVTREAYEEALYDKFGTNYLEQYIEDRVVEQKAEELGVKVDQEDVKQAVDKDVDALLKTRFNGNLEAMRTALNERGMSLEAWRADLTERKRREQLIEKMIKKERGVESESVKKRFEQKYGEGGQKLRVRHILVSTKVINSRFYTKEQYEKEEKEIAADTRALATKVMNELKGGKDFAELAKSHSDDFTASRGGDLGESWKGRFGKEFDAAVGRQGVGQPPSLIQGKRGWHILEVTDLKRGIQYKGSAILVSTGPNGPGDKRTREDRVKEAKEKIKKIQAELEGGKDFAEVARAQSDDIATKGRGGKLGTFGRRRLGNEVDAVLEEAKAPTVTEPIESPRGFWIVNLKSKKMVPAKDKKVVRHIFLSTEYDDVKKRMLGGKIEEMAKARAGELLQKVKEGADFAKLAEEESEDAYTRKTGGEYLNYRKTSLGPEIWAAIQEMKPEGDPTIVQSRRGFHIVQLIERTTTKFEDVKAELLKEINDQPVNPSEQRNFVKRLKEEASIDRKIGPKADEGGDKGGEGAESGEAAEVKKGEGGVNGPVKIDKKDEASNDKPPAPPKK